MSQCRVKQCKKISRAIHFVTKMKIITFALDTDRQIMLPRKKILSALRTLREPLREFGVSRIGLFGSYVRNEASESSDIDIIIDFEENKETYLNFINSCETLENEFKNQKLDIVTLKGLSPFIGAHILDEVEYV